MHALFFFKKGVRPPGGAGSSPMRGCRKAAIFLALCGAALLVLNRDRPWLQQNEAAIEQAVQARLRVAEAELRQTFAAGPPVVAGCPGCPAAAGCPSCPHCPQPGSAAERPAEEGEVARLRAELARAEAVAAAAAVAASALALPAGGAAAPPPASQQGSADCTVQYREPELNKYMGGCVEPKASGADGECAGQPTLESAQVHL